MSTSLETAADREAPAGGQPLGPRLLAGGAWAVGGKLLGTLATLGVNALLARLLAPEDMGVYFLLVSLAGFGALVACLGLKQVLVRLVTEAMALGQPGRAGAALRSVERLVAFGALLAAGAWCAGLGDWLAAGVFDSPRLAAVTGLTALWIAMLALQAPGVEVFRALHDVRLAVLLDGVLASLLLAPLLLAVWLWWGELRLAGAVGLSVASAALALLLGVALQRPSRRRLRGRGSARTSEVLRIAMPLFLTGLATQGMTSFSLWVVAAGFSEAELALYGAAWKLAQWMFVPLLLVNAFLQPVIVELLARDEPRRLERVLRGTATLASLPALALMATFLFCGPQVLAAVYGEYYGGAGLVLGVLGLGQLVNVLTGSCGQVLALSGHQKAMMQVTLLTSALTAAALVLAARHHGLLGVAVAVAAGRLVQNLALWLLVRRRLGVWTHPTLAVTPLREALGRALATLPRPQPRTRPSPP